MSHISDVKKTFEDSLRRVDDLIDGMRSKRDRIKAEFEQRLESLQFGCVDWSRFEEFFEEPYVAIPKRANECTLLLLGGWIFRSAGWNGRQRATTFLSPTST